MDEKQTAALREVFEARFGNDPERLQRDADGGYVHPAVNFCWIDGWLACYQSLDPQWQPIETAPKDGSRVLLGNMYGAWIGMYHPVYQSGFRPENPWSSMMLNHEHMTQCDTTPTHWMPLPAAPDAAREQEKKTC